MLFLQSRSRKDQTFLLCLFSNSNSFWKSFELYNSLLKKRKVHLIITYKDIVIGILTPSSPLLNYLVLLGKTDLWSFRRNEVLPNVNSFKVVVNTKYEIDKYKCIKNNSLQKLMDK